MSEKSPIDPKMSVLDVVHRFKSTEQVFRSYDQKAGVCVLCEALFESLEGFAARFDINLAELTSRLENACKQDKVN